LKKERLKQGARKLVEVNGRATPEDRILVITDYTMQGMAEYIIDAARATGAEVVTCIMPPRKRDGQEPPAAVAAAMREATLYYNMGDFNWDYSNWTRIRLFFRWKNIGFKTKF